jgi:hypothetical protein
MPRKPDMDTTRKGDTLEKRFARIMEGMGYMMAAKAVRQPIYGRPGGPSTRPVVIGGRPIDLVRGTIDSIFVHPQRRVALAQVTTVNGLSERRQKLREVLPSLPLQHVEPILAGWDAGLRLYRLYRAEEDFLESGWRLATGDIELPWWRPAEPTIQVKL